MTCGNVPDTVQSKNIKLYNRMLFTIQILLKFIYIFKSWDQNQTVNNG